MVQSAELERVLWKLAILVLLRLTVALVTPMTPATASLPPAFIIANSLVSSTEV